MSKALIIKGANFYQNRLTTVVISNPVPCTGIAISQASVNLTNIGQTIALTATVTPLNTTDQITWQSSDTNVVTVNNGVVTCVGVGTATISVVCGTEIATCEITASITIDANTELLAINRRYTQSTELANGKDYVSVSEAGTEGGTDNKSRSRVYCLESNADTGYYKFNSGSSVTFGYPIPIPPNTSVIKVNTSEFKSYGGQLSLLDGLSMPTYSISNKGARAVCVDRVVGVRDGNITTYDISEYNGYNSFVLSLQALASVDASTLTGSVTITFE